MEKTVIFEYNGLVFEWDSDKEKTVYEKRGISFKEVCSVFFDLNEFTMIDDRFDYNEHRYITVGISHRLKLLTVSWTERQGNIRLITVIKAGNKYEKRYRQGR